MAVGGRGRRPTDSMPLRPAFSRALSIKCMAQRQQRPQPVARRSRQMAKSKILVCVNII